MNTNTSNILISIHKSDYLDLKNTIKELVQIMKTMYEFEDQSKTEQIDNILISIHKSDFVELHNELKEDNFDIKELKNTLKDLVHVVRTV